MHQRRYYFIWVILLLVGLSFVNPDSVEVSPAPSQGSAVALIDSEDVDDPDHSRASTLIAHPDLALLLLALFLTGLPLSGHFQPSAQSTSLQFLLLSLRSPRSPTAS